VERPIALAAVASSWARYTPAPEEAVEPERKAAVAAVFRDAREGCELLFIRRAEHPLDPWSGHMGLPGGRVDAADVSLLAAAIRETREELGLDLAALARPLGRLSEVRTHIGRPHSVVPFGFALEIAEPPELVLNHEVAEALWVPLAFLLDRHHRSWYTWRRGGIPVPMPCYRYQGREIWGLTLRIVDELLEVLANVWPQSGSRLG